MREQVERCELCGSSEDYLNFHHLIPRTLHGKKWYRDRYTVAEMRTRGLWLCKFHCHKQVHELVAEADLGRTYNTKDALLAHPKVAAYVGWRAKRVR